MILSEEWKPGTDQRVHHIRWDRGWSQDERSVWVEMNVTVRECFIVGSWGQKGIKCLANSNEKTLIVYEKMKRVHTGLGAEPSETWSGKTVTDS